MRACVPSPEHAHTDYEIDFVLGLLEEEVGAYEGSVENFDDLISELYGSL